MRLQSLFSIILMCAPVVTMCRGEGVVQEPVVDAHSGGNIAALAASLFGCGTRNGDISRLVDLVPNVATKKIVAPGKDVVTCAAQDIKVKKKHAVNRKQAGSVVDGVTDSAYERWVKSNDLPNEEDGADLIKREPVYCPGEKYRSIIFEEVDGSYDSLLQEAAERRWAIPLTLDYSFESKAFDACGNKVPLSGALFGSGTRIRDIFLLARLSDDDNLHIHPPIVPTNPQFGHVRNEQYLALIAPTKIGLTATQSNAMLGFNALYRWRPCEDTRLFCIFGLDFPVQIQQRSLDFCFQDGTLFKAGYISNATNRENVLTQFFKDWTGVEDFFLRGVLAPKGIAFIPTQQTIGLGDISLSASLEFGPFYTESECGECRGLDFGQVGLSIGFPTGKKADAGVLWGPEFGNGGGYQFTLFSTFNTRTGNWFNPTMNFGVELHTTACRSGANGLRVPRIVTGAQEQRVIDNPDLVAPVFKEYRTDAFSEMDTTVAIFADKVANASLKVGRRAFVGIGNYFYDVFANNFRLGLFYNYSSKNADTVTVNDPAFVTTSLQYPTSAHRFSWKLSYKFKNMMELGFGSQHLLAGKSVPEQHDFFLSFVASF